MGRFVLFCPFFFSFPFFSIAFPPAIHHTGLGKSRCLMRANGTAFLASALCDLLSRSNSQSGIVTLCEAFGNFSDVDGLWINCSSSIVLAEAVVLEECNCVCKVAHWCSDQMMKAYIAPSLGALPAYPDLPLKLLLLRGDCDQLRGYTAFVSYCICSILHLLQTFAPEARSEMLNLNSVQGPLDEPQPRPSQELLLFNLLHLSSEQ